MQKLNLEQFIKKFPQSKFMRFFYDYKTSIKTQHFCIYVKYEENDSGAKCLDTVKSILKGWNNPINNEMCMLLAFDKTFTCDTLKREFDDITKVVVNLNDKNYYINLPLN